VAGTVLENVIGAPVPGLISIVIFVLGCTCSMLKVISACWFSYKEETAETSVVVTVTVWETVVVTGGEVVTGVPVVTVGDTVDDVVTGVPVVTVGDTVDDVVTGVPVVTVGDTADDVVTGMPVVTVGDVGWEPVTSLPVVVEEERDEGDTSLLVIIKRSKSIVRLPESILFPPVSLTINVE
jgi:hypothetical protein